MNQSHTPTAVNFGPYRALLRALLLREPERCEGLLREFGLRPADLMFADIEVSGVLIAGLWKIAEGVASGDPFFALDAAQVFQFRDLGERGWLLQAAADLAQAICVFRDYFSADNFSFAEGNGRLICSWNPLNHQSPLMPHYFIAVVITALLGQGIPASSVKEITLPIWSAPATELGKNLLLARLRTRFALNISFDAQNVALELESAVLKQPFRSTDSALFAFFVERCRKVPEVRNKCHNVFDSGLRHEVKRLLLSNLASAHFSVPHIAAELGVSGRTLERALAKDSLCLRSLRQQLQCETAIELLHIGLRAKEVAAQIGFSDVTAFSRAFRKWTGKSPSQIKRK